MAVRFVKNTKSGNKFAPSLFVSGDP